MVNIYITKEVIETNFFDGEMGEFEKMIDNKFFGSGKTVEEALNDIWNNYRFTKDWHDNVIKQDGKLLYKQLEGYSGNIPFDEDIEDWKKGKINLYTAYYWITVKKEINMSIDNLF